ncbi:MAG: sodium/proline symporter [Deltaproteobacteria bacterium]|jgi:sodium/proline symporter
MDAVFIGFVVYLVVVLVAGALTYKLNETQEDFLLAGRKLNIWVATFSERASGESAWLLLGLPAAALAVGMGEAWTVVGCVTGIALSWIFVAERLRRDTEKYDALTLPEYFMKRFGDRSSNAIRFVATAIIVFFYSFYVAAQFNGAGKVLDVTFGIPQPWGIVLGAVVIILYTMMGGFFAVAWTDFLQAILMFATLVILPIVAYSEITAGGGTMALAADKASWFGDKTGIAAFAAVVGGLSWGFGYFGQPHTVTRYMSLADPKSVKIGRVIAISWAVPAFIGAMAIGIAGATMYAGVKFDDPEQLMPRMATDLLPGWLAGIFISGAVAAMMSTADSQLLVGTSAVAEDFYRRGLNKELTQKRLVWISRVVTIGLGLAGFVLAVVSDKLIFALVSYAWSGLGSSFGPALLACLYWKGTTARGVLWGMITGATTTVIWSNLDVLNDTLNVRAGAFVLATIAVIVGSLTDRAGRAA